MSELQVGGITPLTSIDFPGELAAVIFCQGCPWRCRYCHNGHMLPRKATGLIPWDEALHFLHKRRGLLDAVVFSGGEPTLQTTLPDAMREVKQLGFKIGLHTAGCYPKRLREVLPLCDWVGLDIKALPEDYPVITQIPRSGEKAWESLEILLASGVDHQIRTTPMPGTSSSRLQLLSNTLRLKGVPEHVLQECRTQHSLDPTLSPYSRSA